MNVWDRLSSRPFLKFVLECTLWAILLGLAMDMVTAHVDVRYFSVHHPPIFEHPTSLNMALYWGIAASWWFGTISALVFAALKSLFQWRWDYDRLSQLVRRSCMVLWVVFMLELVGFYLLAGAVDFKQVSDNREADRRLIAVAFTHASEYLFGGIALAWIILRASLDKWKSTRTPKSPA